MPWTSTPPTPAGRRFRIRTARDSACRRGSAGPAAVPTIPDITGASVPAWIGAEPARRRMRVWTVTGMLASVARLGSADALDLIRGYAFHQDLTLDDVSSKVIDGSLPIQLIWTAETPT